MTTPQQNQTGVSVRHWQAACGVLLVALVAVVGWAMHNDRAYQRYVQERINEYPLIDTARNFIGQEHFIVNIQPLREKIRAMVEEFEAEGGDVSLYFEFLNTGANISINPDKRIYPASLAKVPIAMAAMKKVQNGEWKLSNELVLMEDDRDTRSGAEGARLGERPVGTRFTIEELLRELLVNSDNSAYFMLLRNISKAELNEFLENTGLENLFTDEGKISSKEYSRILRSLYTSSFLSRANSQQILEWLDEGAFDKYLAGSIPEPVTFSHKYGAKVELGVYADSGIAYLPNRPYLVSIMVQGRVGNSQAEEERAARLMRGVSKEIYDYLVSVRQ